VALLSPTPTVQQHAKDVLQAPRLPLLPAEDSEVARDLAKVAAGQPLSPVLLIRGEVTTGRVLQIADGYHRVCASYLVDEDTDVACRLVGVCVAATGRSLGHDVARRDAHAVARSHLTRRGGVTGQVPPARRQRLTGFHDGFLYRHWASHKLVQCRQVGDQR
jgi:hypothetical protein